MRDRRARLPSYNTVTVVCAHPDDESFGLGALIAAFADLGARLRLVCFTVGESSTLGAGPDLGSRRAAELECAAWEFGIDAVTVLHHPDGALPTVPLENLAASIVAAGPAVGCPAHLRPGRDHRPSRSRARHARRRVRGKRTRHPCLGLGHPRDHRSHAANRVRYAFVGREQVELDLTVPVDRTRQLRAIACHGSQLLDNPVPHRRIDLSRDTEVLRLLHDPTPHPRFQQEIVT